MFSYLIIGVVAQRLPAIFHVFLLLFIVTAANTWVVVIAIIDPINAILIVIDHDLAI